MRNHNANISLLKRIHLHHISKKYEKSTNIMISHKQEDKHKKKLDLPVMLMYIFMMKTEKK